MVSPIVRGVDQLVVNTLGWIQRVRNGARYRTVRTDDGRTWPVCHRTPEVAAANDGVPIVFFHGFGNDGSTWLPLFPILGTRRELVAPDLPGFGRHPLLDEEDPTPTWYCQVAARFLQELTVRWGQPPIVVGKSLGGMIAGLVAGAVPDLVRAVVLIDPGGLEAPVISPFWDAWSKGTNHLLPGNEEEWERMVKILYHQPVRIPGFMRRHALETLQRKRHLYERIFQRLLAEGYNPLGERLSRITCPVTIIWGEEDHMMDPSAVDLLRTAIPSARINVIPECGHSPTRERPEEVKRILLGVLNRWG